MPILAILSTKHKGISSRDARGSVPKMRDDGFASELGGIMGCDFAYHCYLDFDVV